MTDVLPTSAGFDPRQAEDDLRRAKEEMAGPVPLIETTPDCAIDLPRGVFAREDWQRRAEVRELTGADEEAMAKFREPGEIFDALLCSGVTRIGQLDLATMPLAERKDYLHRLLIGERDQLFVAIMRATYGDTRTLNLTCRSCGESQELVLDMVEDFQPKEVENVTDETFPYVTTKGDRLEVRPATGGDQAEVLARKSISLAETNSVILSRCILKVNDGLVVDPLNYARGLSMRDRQALLASLVARQPTVDMSVSVTCVACEEEQTIDLGWVDLFRA